MNTSARYTVASPRTALETLRGHYLFAALDNAQWQAIQRHVHERTLRSSERLFSQGESASEFYVVCEGSIKLFRDSAQGLEKIMRLARAGQGFAESVLFSDPPHYPVHAEAIGHTRVIAVERSPYLALLEASGDTCRAVMQQMVKRIYAHWDEIEMLTLHSSSARVARYLLGLHDRGPHDQSVLKLPVAKVLIAAELGLAPETLSRAFRRLTDGGLIEVAGATVTIRDFPALQRRAHF
ncbi:MAG: Crp/Fnr family transcriptional regulator [Nevskiaceae bacterium]|nr:MAG: Crp/Fnr family transcriptional regulator [Nevskiaceae bacterium]TBR72741.1 MAG: Crp/Fnr family transcriptional regulator [Nevskiaceae bacterium]